ncbi:MAG: hypothetical protein C4332_07995 [Meiothermus sp.]
MKRYVFGLVLLLLLMGLAASLKGIPKEIAGYNDWKVVAQGNLPTGGPHAGQNKEVYANPVAFAAWKSGKALPVGSILVKTAGPDGAPTFVAEMRKDAKGWYYVEYGGKGGMYDLMAGGNMSQALCQNCHAKAKDYVFTRK